MGKNLQITKILLIRFFVSLVAVLVAITFIELLARLLLPMPENLAKLQSSSLFLYENKPNANFTTGGVEFSNQITFNSTGFRDLEFNPHKSADVFRIAVLGDSQEEALQVPLEDTWQKIMANILSQSLNRKIEAYNFGVSGYGTDQQWLTLRQKVWPFSPDMVILAFSPNDLGDIYKNKLIKLDNGQIKLTSAQERAGGNTLGKLARQTYVYHLIVKAASANWETKKLIDKIRTKILGFAPEERFFLSDAQLTQGPFEVIASQKNPPQEVLQTWQLAEKLILDMQKQATSHGAQFLVTINIPRAQVLPSDWDVIRDHYHLDPDSASPHQINDVLSQIAKTHQLNFYDERLDAISWKQQYGDLHYPIDAHFNKNGHLFMATRLAQFILNNQLIK